LKVKINRSEVLAYNFCFGNKTELTAQFNDVRKLNTKLSKPVMHITLSLSPGENVSKEKLTSFVEDCAKALEFDNRQYLAVTHKDTSHQHLHIVVNRTGLDGKTLSDSHNYRKISDFCRKMERKYNLKPVLSPRRFLPKELRSIPRLDARKENLKKKIQSSLVKSSSLEKFISSIKKDGYSVIKGRGIAFIDSKKVSTKGSEIGYPLSKIERILAVNQRQKIADIGYKDGASSSKNMSLDSFGEFQKQSLVEKILLDELLKAHHLRYEEMPKIQVSKKKMGRKRLI